RIFRISVDPTLSMILYSRPGPIRRGVSRRSSKTDSASGKSHHELRSLSIAAERFGTAGEGVGSLHVVRLVRREETKNDFSAAGHQTHQSVELRFGVSFLAQIRK